jgi:type IV fimbrial biogenesis protein FimT
MPVYSTDEQTRVPYAKRRHGACHTSNEKHARGFTLIELATVLAIACILAGLALPSFRLFVSGSKLSTLSNELLGAFLYARNEAITRNKRVTICARDAASTGTLHKCAAAGDAWEQGWIVYVDDGATFNQVDPDEKILRYRERLDDGFTVRNNCAGGAIRNISYNSGGQPRGSFTGGDLAVAAAGGSTREQRHLCFARGGRIRVQDAYCTHPQPC